MSQRTDLATLNILTKISDQLERIEQTNQSDTNLAILWDVENVNPGNDSLFIDGFFDYLSNFGRITVAQAFADWKRQSVSKIATPLTNNHFELIHVPRARKNSADISLIVHGIEMALQNPSISTFILVTGDSDFRSLILSLRRSGKKVHIICDVKTASPDLLILADSFKDFRELRLGGTTAEEAEESSTADSSTKHKEKKQETEQKKTVEDLKELRSNAFSLLEEAVIQMKKDKLKPGMGLVKVRLKMLNPTFDEKTIGFSGWGDFVKAAVEAGIINVRGKAEALILDVPEVIKKKELSDQEKAFEMLLKVLRDLDKSPKPRYHDQSQVAAKLHQKQDFVNIRKKLGYKKFKDFIQAAEVRKLLETKVDGLTHYIRLVKK